MQVADNSFYAFLYLYQLQVTPISLTCPKPNVPPLALYFNIVRYSNTNITFKCLWSRPSPTHPPQMHHV